MPKLTFEQIFILLLVAGAIVAGMFGRTEVAGYCVTGAVLVWFFS